jgi:hypothetical protein
MVSDADEAWLKQCQPENLPVPPFDRHIYMLPQYVVKKRLQPGELGYYGYQPEFSTIEQRDENEIRVLRLSVSIRISLSLSLYIGVEGELGCDIRESEDYL